MAFELMGVRRQSGGLHSGGYLAELLPQRRCCRGIRIHRRFGQADQCPPVDVEVGCVGHRGDLMLEGGQHLGRSRR